MSGDFDFVSATDKPALLAFSTPEWLEQARAALQELGYKVHTAATHSDFLIRFSQFRYQVVILEELFAANSITENTPMQAFQQSVNAVINSSEIFLLKQLIEKSVADNDFFLHSFREAQANLYAENKPS